MLCRAQDSTPNASMRRQQSAMRRSRAQGKSRGMGVEAPQPSNPECGIEAPPDFYIAKITYTQRGTHAIARTGRAAEGVH